MASSLTQPLTRSAARAGLIAKGLMYVLLSVVVARLAVPGRDGRPVDSDGALRSLAAQPGGRALLAALAVGFAAYAVWQVRCAIKGDETEAKVAAALRSVLWTGLAFTAFRVVARSGGSTSERSITARLLGEPYGPWLVAAVGAGIVIAAIVMLKTLKGQEYLTHLRPLPAGTRRLVTATAVVGIVARTLVYGLAGGFLVRAAFTHDARRGVGLDGALSQVAQQPYGRYALAAAAVGLAAFAVWCVVRARYEDVERSDG